MQAHKHTQFNGLVTYFVQLYWNCTRAMAMLARSSPVASSYWIARSSNSPLRVPGSGPARRYAKLYNRLPKLAGRKKRRWRCTQELNTWHRSTQEIFETSQVLSAPTAVLGDVVKGRQSQQKHHAVDACPAQHAFVVPISLAVETVRCPLASAGASLLVGRIRSFCAAHPHLGPIGRHWCLPLRQSPGKLHHVLHMQVPLLQLRETAVNNDC